MSLAYHSSSFQKDRPAPGLVPSGLRNSCSKSVWYNLHQSLAVVNINVAVVNGKLERSSLDYLTVYDLSIWTSLKCATWMGFFSVDTKILGFEGAGLGKGTVNLFTAGSVQRPRTALQNLVAVCPSDEIDRKSWAIIGPCSVKRP